MKIQKFSYDLDKNNNKNNNNKDLKKNNSNARVQYPSCLL